MVGKVFLVSSSEEGSNANPDFPSSMTDRERENDISALPSIHRPSIRLLCEPIDLSLSLVWSLPHGPGVKEARHSIIMFPLFF